MAYRSGGARKRYLRTEEKVIHAGIFLNQTGALHFHDKAVLDASFGLYFTSQKVLEFLQQGAGDVIDKRLIEYGNLLSSSFIDFQNAIAAYQNEVTEFNVELPVLRGSNSSMPRRTDIRNGTGDLIPQTNESSVALRK